MKKIIGLCIALFTLVAFSASASTFENGHKYKKSSKAHKVKHHHKNADPSYNN